MAKKKGKSGRLRRILILVVLVVVAVGGVKLFQLYQRVYWPNVQVAQGDSTLLIPTGSDLKQVAALLESRGFIINRHSFEWLAEKKNYRGDLVVPGKYELKDGMSNDALIDHLRAGNGRLEVKVTFNNLRTIEQLAGRLASNLEPDSLDLLGHLSNPEVQGHFGFNMHTFRTLFIPNTYFFDWASSPEDVLDRMAAEYRRFWTEERKQKARNLGLSQSQVVILASIVQAEQSIRRDEHPRIAGLYLNRLKKGMKLQSDPTVVFAIGDFTMNRVLNEHLKVKSPYNTYRRAGLPPGPILFPEISTVDAVLNAEQHNYIFMCAKDDFSGYHYFATNLRQHNVYAQRYREALNKKRIYR